MIGVLRGLRRVTDSYSDTALLGEVYGPADRVAAAFGAARRDVVGLVVGRAARLTGVGLAVGLAGALGAAQLMRSLLIGVSPRDPVTFVVIAALLGLVGLVAAAVPARRAARVDAMVALRSE